MTWRCSRPVAEVSTDVTKRARELELQVEPEDDLLQTHGKTCTRSSFSGISKQNAFLRWNLLLMTMHEDYQNDNKGLRILHMLTLNKALAGFEY